VLRERKYYGKGIQQDAVKQYRGFLWRHERKDRRKEIDNKPPSLFIKQQLKSKRGMSSPGH